MNMKRFVGFVVLIVVLSQATVVFSGDVNMSQFFFVLKRIFPDLEEVSLFASPSDFAAHETVIVRSAMQHKLQVKYHQIETVYDVGQGIRKISKNSVLVVLSSDVLMKKSTQLYVLKNCKDKNVAVATAEREYTDLGALLGLLRDENKKLQLVLNLKQNDQQREKFTDEFIQYAGIGEVIQ